VFSGLLSPTDRWLFGRVMHEAMPGRASRVRGGSRGDVPLMPGESAGSTLPDRLDSEGMHGPRFTPDLWEKVRTRHPLQMCWCLNLVRPQLLLLKRARQSNLTRA
jgi:hypothetical protein